MKTCNDCPERFGCIEPCEEVNLILASIYIKSEDINFAKERIWA